MNDFTKEELEFMHKWLNWITEENYPLKNKIQSMIDNYSETCGLCNRTNCEDCPCR